MVLESVLQTRSRAEKYHYTLKPLILVPVLTYSDIVMICKDDLSLEQISLA